MYYNMSGDGFYNLLNYTWLRSGNNERAYTSGYLTSSGYGDGTYSARRLAVRPALYKAVDNCYHA